MTEPLLNVADDGEINIVGLQKNGKLAAKVDFNTYYCIS